MLQTVRWLAHVVPGSKMLAVRRWPIGAPSSGATKTVEQLRCGTQGPVSLTGTGSTLFRHVLAATPHSSAVAVGSGLLSQSAPPEGVVVIDGAPLRSADSTGARLAFAHPLPAGAEVTILETRDGWLRVALADGTRGWIMANSVAPVQPQTDSHARVSAQR